MTNIETIKKLKKDKYHDFYCVNTRSINSLISAVNTISDKKYFTKSLDIKGIESTRVYRYL